MREYNGNKDLSVENISTFIDRYKSYVDVQAVNLGIQRKKQEIVQYWNEYIDVAKQYVAQFEEDFKALENK